MNSGYIFISRKAIIVTWVVFYRVNYPTTNVPLPQVQEDFREQARIVSVCVFCVVSPRKWRCFYHFNQLGYNKFFHSKSFSPSSESFLAFS